MIGRGLISLIRMKEFCVWGGCLVFWVNGGGCGMKYGFWVIFFGYGLVDFWLLFLVILLKIIIKNREKDDLEG